MRVATRFGQLPGAVGATGPHVPTRHAFPPLWMWPRFPTHPRPPGLRRNLDQPGCRLPRVRHRAPRVNKGACDAAGGGAAEDTTIGSGWVGQSPLSRVSRVRIEACPSTTTVCPSGNGSVRGRSIGSLRCRRVSLNMSVLRSRWQRGWGCAAVTGPGACRSTSISVHGRVAYRGDSSRVTITITLVDLGGHDDDDTEGATDRSGLCPLPSCPARNHLFPESDSGD